MSIKCVVEVGHRNGSDLATWRSDSGLVVCDRHRSQFAAGVLLGGQASLVAAFVAMRRSDRRTR